MGMELNKIVRGYWMAVWVVLTPIASVGVFIFTMTDIGQTQFGDYVFPVWADSLGWMMGACTLIPFPIFTIYQLHKHDW
uniref:Uncharacterized protein n=1 Tax=Megaselia scalaris TaxID=36166 RepID=T1GSD5_MEGSC